MLCENCNVNVKWVQGAGNKKSAAHSRAKLPQDPGQGGRNPRHPGPFRYVADDDFVGGGDDDDDRWHKRRAVCFA